MDRHTDDIIVSDLDLTGVKACSNFNAEGFHALAKSSSALNSSAGAIKCRKHPVTCRLDNASMMGCGHLPCGGGVFVQYRSPFFITKLPELLRGAM